MPGGTHPPIGVRLKWPDPNFVDPVTRGPALIILSILLPSLTFFIVSARLWARFFITRAPGVDDAFCVLSLAFGIANSVTVVLACKHYGIGRHNWDQPLDWVVGLAKNQYLATWLALLSLTMIKISVLIFYRRLSVSFTRGFVWATIVGLAWVGFALPIALIVSFALMCQPIEAYWQTYNFAWLAQGHKYTCLRDGTLLPTSAMINTIGDLYTTIIPILLIRQLQLPTKQKVALYGLFAGGFLVCTAGALRTWVLWKIFHQTYDVTWNLWLYWIFNLIEIYLAIIIASLPALKPLMRQFMKTEIYESGRRSKQAGSSGMNSYQLGKHNNALGHTKESLQNESYSAHSPIGHRGIFDSDGINSPPPAYPNRGFPKSLHFRSQTDDTISTVGLATTRSSGESMRTDPTSQRHWDLEGRQSSVTESVLEGSRISFPLPPRSDASWPLRA